MRPLRLRGEQNLRSGRVDKLDVDRNPRLALRSADRKAADANSAAAALLMRLKLSDRRSDKHLSPQNAALFDRSLLVSKLLAHRDFAPDVVEIRSLQEDEPMR